ncbi:MAG: hypothetical protein ACLFR0_07715 [Alphaproteobacteria bacterium]
MKKENLIYSVIFGTVAALGATNFITHERAIEGDAEFSTLCRSSVNDDGTKHCRWGDDNMAMVARFDKGKALEVPIETEQQAHDLLTKSQNMRLHGLEGHFIATYDDTLFNTIFDALENAIGQNEQAPIARGHTIAKTFEFVPE